MMNFRTQSADRDSNMETFVGVKMRARTLLMISEHTVFLNCLNNSSIYSNFRDLSAL